MKQATKSKLVKGMVLAGLLLAAAGQAQASVIFDGGGPDLMSGNEMTAWVEAEDFQLSQADTIRDVHFWTLEDGIWDGGLYWYIFEDKTSAPGATLASGSATSISKTATGNVLFNYNEYAWSFNLDTPFAAAANTTYWLGLHASSDFNRDEIYWETTSPGYGVAGNASSGGTFDNWFSVGRQHAFNLTNDGGATVPEPGSLALLGIGAISMVMGMKRRRKPAA